jgi:hypothetical protein
MEEEKSFNIYHRLLNTPVGDSDNFSPYGYWISRQNKVMDYWAGSLPGSRKCECGLLGVCFDPDKWCNCDSGLNIFFQICGPITFCQMALKHLNNLP